MISTTVPCVIRKVADRVKDVFSDKKLNYNALCVLLCMFLFGTENLSEAVRLFGWSQSVSTLHKNVHRFNQNRFMRRLRASVLKKHKDDLNSDDWCYAIDDTANPKFGKKIFGIGRWGNHSGGIYKGQRIMVLVLINKQKGYAIPIHYFFCLKKIENTLHLTGHDLVIKLLNECLLEGYPILPLALDSWFDSTILMKKLEQLKIPFCIHAKANRRVKHCASSKNKFKSWHEIFKNKIKFSFKLSKTEHQKKRPKTKYLQETIVYIKNRKSPLKACAVYNHKNDKSPFAIYVTNDLKMTSWFLYELSRKRWLQEELFRTLKQSFSFGRLPCTGQAAADLSVCLPFMLLVHIRLKPDEWSQGSDVSFKTIGTITKRITTENLNRSLTFLMSNSKHKVVEKLKARRHVNRINKKPVDSVADGNMVA